nr:histone h1.2 [Quercus suber]
MAATTESRKSSGPKKPKSAPSHPPFLDMITEAIVTLKEKTGSSQYAITKYSEEKHKHLPTSFRKLLLFHLKKLVASGKLVKVKNSFKLAPAAPVKKSSTVSAPAKPKSVAKPKATKVAPKAKKVARTSSRTTPSKKAAPAKKAPKPKSVKSPAAKKKAPARKAKK